MALLIFIWLVICRPNLGALVFWLLCDAQWCTIGAAKKRLIRRQECNYVNFHTCYRNETCNICLCIDIAVSAACHVIDLTGMATSILMVIRVEKCLWCRGSIGYRNLRLVSHRLIAAVANISNKETWNCKQSRNTIMTNNMKGARGHEHNPRHKFYRE